MTTDTPMTRVASAPATGQYSVAAGVYTFAAADTGHNVAIRYSYTSASTGQTIAYTNQAMGSGVTFTLSAFNSYGGQNSGWRLWAATIPKLSLAFKNGDYVEKDIDFEGFADSSGRVIDFYTE